MENAPLPHQTPDAVPSGRTPLRRALLLANDRARQVREHIDRATQLLQGFGFELYREPLPEGRRLGELIREYRDRVDLVIVGGGDGTLNSAVDALVETGLPLGILPLGTANDLARTLHIPADLEEACRVIGERHTRWIDLGCVNGKHYFNVASIGLSVNITQRLTRDVKKRWGVLAYLIAAARVLWRTRPFRAEIRCGNEVWFGRTLQITVGNGRFYGGGMTVAEDATIHDQRLDLYSLEVQHWWQVLPLLRALRTGDLANRAYVRTLSGQEIEVRTWRPRPINTDGEITAMAPAKFQIVPRALRVIAPPGPQGEQGAAPGAAKRM